MKAELLAVLDENTCFYCKANHGKVREYMNMGIVSIMEQHHAHCSNPDGCRCVVKVIEEAQDDAGT